MEENVGAAAAAATFHKTDFPLKANRRPALYLHRLGAQQRGSRPALRTPSLVTFQCFGVSLNAERGHRTLSYKHLGVLSVGDDRHGVHEFSLFKS